MVPVAEEQNDLDAGKAVQASTASVAASTRWSLGRDNQPPRARRVGYGSEEALSRAFKLRFGGAPSVIRRRTRLLGTEHDGGGSGTREHPLPGSG
jgi:hypothetical protein